MGKPTGYVVGDDGTMQPTYDQQDVAPRVGSVAFVEPDLEAIALTVGVDLQDLADLDDKLVEAGSSLEAVAKAAKVTQTQVQAVVILFLGLVQDNQDNQDDEGEQGEAPANPPAPAPADPSVTQEPKVPNYGTYSKKQLEDEVKLRNSERKTDDVDYIVVDAPGNKPELVAALQADDQVED